MILYTYPLSLCLRVDPQDPTSVSLGYVMSKIVYFVSLYLAYTYTRMYAQISLAPLSRLLTK